MNLCINALLYTPNMIAHDIHGTALRVVSRRASMTAIVTRVNVVGITMSHMPDSATTINWRAEMREGENKTARFAGFQ